MNFLGFNISRATTTKAAPPVPVSENRGGWYRIFESFAGAWQQNVTVDYNQVLSNHAVFSCMTLIASDISKLRVKLVEQDSTGIWTETESPAFSPVLRKPNRFQNRIQYWENYVLSKLMRGNTYVLLVRDQRGIVIRQIVLAPDRVTPMVADDGSVFYQLKTDNMSGLTQDIMVPASEIIHDRFNCLFHPLVGLSPIYAAGVAATQGLAIQSNSSQFFTNKSQPGGILTAPGQISDETAERLKAAWESKFTGENAGKIAVVGDGLKYEPITLSAEDSQLIEQFKWSAEIICSTFHVPGFMLGLGPMPTNNNVEALLSQYYSQALQVLIEAAELCQDEALGIGVGSKKDGHTFGTEFDLDNLLRMDTATQYKTIADGIRGGFLAPNEARKRLDLKPLKGGDTVYLQEQDHSLEALAERDAGPDPFGKAKTETPVTPVDPANDNSDEARAQRSARRRETLAKKVGLKSVPLAEPDTGTAVPVVARV